MAGTLGEGTDSPGQARPTGPRETILSIQPAPSSSRPTPRLSAGTRRSQPMSRLTEGSPTLATVAQAAGVSRQTVSNALNSPDLLRPDTLARVQQAIEELGYSPNRAARSLRTRAS